MSHYFGSILTPPLSHFVTHLGTPLKYVTHLGTSLPIFRRTKNWTKPSVQNFSQFSKANLKVCVSVVVVVSSFIW